MKCLKTVTAICFCPQQLFHICKLIIKPQTMWSICFLCQWELTSFKNLFRFSYGSEVAIICLHTFPMELSLPNPLLYWTAPIKGSWRVDKNDCTSKSKVRFWHKSKSFWSLESCLVFKSLSTWEKAAVIFPMHLIKSESKHKFTFF